MGFGVLNVSFLIIPPSPQKFDETKVVGATYAGDVSYVPRSRIADCVDSLFSPCRRYTQSILSGAGISY